MDMETRDRVEHTSRWPGGQRGQVFVIFVGAMLTFVLFVSLVIDVSWYWANSLRVQRAADAAALAGVIYLPNQPAKANTAAYGEATKNGYTAGTAGAIVTPQQDPSDPRRMIVDIEAPVRTFFMRVVGIETIQARRRAKAEYILPVPMGSPLNYYGVFGALRTPTGTSSATFSPSATHAPNGWTTPANAYTSDNVYATNATGADQGYAAFNIVVPGGATIVGIEVLTEARSNDSSGCQIGVALSWDNGVTFTTQKTAALTGSDTVLSTGGATDTWGRTWTILQLSDATFVVRVRDVDPGTSCTDSATTSLDQLRVRVHTPLATVNGPGGETLSAQGFWGTMISQGSEDVNGDAFLAMYDQRSTGTLNPDYKPNSFYNYGVEMPAGSSNGEVWVFDAPFCATSTTGQYGTGDRWFDTTRAATSAFYDLYDMNGTAWDMTDDTLVASSGGLFRQIRASDPDLNGPAVGGGILDCSAGAVTNPADGRYWHNRWWQLASGLAGNRMYRIKVSSTDAAAPSDQNNANGHNSFSFFTRAAGTPPRVYGAGTMQAFSPLNGGGASQFYLAQIDAVHAGKVLEIKLWDPGDTNLLSANLQILQPATGGYTPATFSWASAKGTTHSSASGCNGSTGTNVTSVVTNTGGTQVFNGCWLTITVPLPTTYTAPIPPGEQEPGWWKIRYNMGGSTSDNAFDLTTWQASLRGNPVHLVVP